MEVGHFALKLRGHVKYEVDLCTLNRHPKAPESEWSHQGTKNIHTFHVSGCSGGTGSCVAGFCSVCSPAGFAFIVVGTRGHPIAREG